ncbi:thiamine diphosphate-binding protein [Annulohypoxylon truncatum]|uniref:thiamine diphosphate-binding protein n=1 Tax=Annulohypoxylon truncatum TaxID=327061 RepID=UPI002007524B|nr:thiamine diphosphate-binding protein [Annulohypoxylon truncatum]KAI1205417.1 thiamine diphosphate-binding protein [Annulohypoxylon truncatum]
MPATLKLSEYLFARLKQLGIDSLHGVPGDYNLNLLDFVEPAGLHWVGNANELNAGYAADGYARIKGIGALVTTFGVGELSAINAIAGAYAERAAVVHIVGTPPRESQDSRLLIHHTFNDGEYRRFAQMHQPVTVAQANLRDPRTSPAQIDYVLQQCLLHSRPVYLEIPVDLVAAPVSAEQLQNNICLPTVEPNAYQDSVIDKVLDKIYEARQPIILVDGEVRALGIIGDVQKLVSHAKWPTWSSGFGKGLLDETLPNFHGIYRGNFDDAKVQSFFKNSDLVLCFGPHFSTTNSFASSSIPKTQTAILFTDTEIRINGQVFRDIPARYAVSQLLLKIDSSRIISYTAYPDLPRDQSDNFTSVSQDGPIKQDRLWRILSTMLRPGDIVLGETGTAGYGCREMALPRHVRLFTPVTWLSIGYMLGAAQGAALAQRELISSSNYHGIKNARTILFIGDGSFQMTVQELGTIIRNNLDVVLFLINNDGYTIERCIHGLKAGYNDVASWRYLQAPSFFGASGDTYTASARTWGDLEKVLGSGELDRKKGLKMVEIFMEREDVPKGPLAYLLQLQTTSQ